MITDMDYLNISALTFGWLGVNSGDEGRTVGELMDILYPEDIPPAELSALMKTSNPVRDYTIVKVQDNTSTGFAGIVLQSPSGELVFALRGTEAKEFSPLNPLGELDILMDAQLALPDSLLGPPGQFTDAAKFFVDTIAEVGSGNYTDYSFTGHSLGGGLAQYMTYWTNNVGKSVTFNAVGIGQAITLDSGQTYSSFNSKDFVNENDIIGNFGTQLGTTVFLKDNDPNRVNYGDMNDVLAYYGLRKALQENGIALPSEGASALLLQTYLLYMNQINGVVEGSIDAHGLSAFLTQNSLGDYVFTDSTTGSKIQGLTDILSGDGVSVATDVANGVTYVQMWLSTGQEIVVGYAEGVLDISIKTGQAVWNTIYSVGTTVGDIIYDMAVTIGGIGEDFAEFAVAIYQYFFSDYVVLNGTDDADHLSPIFYDKGAIINGHMGDDTITGSSRDDILDGGLGDDTIYGWGGADYIYGKHGNDIIQGGGGGDVLFGGAGDDILYGGDDRNWESFLNPEHAADILDGGAGNDILEGGAGNDTYIFGKGYGHDVIRDWAQDVVGSVNAGFDTLKFLAGVDPSDVAVHRRDNGLEFKIISTGETITDETFSYTNSPYSNQNRTGIDQVVFADGTVWDKDVLLEKARHIYGTAAGETINGYYGQDNIIYAGAGDDTVNGAYDADTLYGHAGNDTLEGSSGNDLLDGGTGNDILRGGADNDIYVFGRGYGHDTIIDEVPYSGSPWAVTDGGDDAIFFNADVAASDLDVYRVGMYDLEFRIRGTDDILTVKNHFSSSKNHSIEAVAFSNGDAMWDMQEIAARARNTVGTSDDETLHGDDANNTITGNGGNDLIYGNGGGDTLDGGTGNDRLEGGTGNDTYIFGLGYGVDTIFDSDAATNNLDTIRFLAGINPSDVVIARNGDNVELSIAGTDDKIIIERYFSAYNQSNSFVGVGAHKIERFEFADGTIWTNNNIEDVIRTINGTESSDEIYGHNDLANIITSGGGDDYVVGGSLNDEINAGSGDDTVHAGAGNDTLIGGAGNDTLYGNAGNDKLDGGTGNDMLEGGEGNDTYIFGIGYGNDTIYDSDTTVGNQDKIRFLEGVAPEDVQVSRDGENLILTIIGTTDTLTVEKYFSEYGRSFGWNSPHVGENGNKIEVIEFANGMTWSIADVKDKARYINGTEGGDYLSGYSDQQNIISAGNGDDTIYAAHLGDELHGGAGNDELYGNAGDDLLVGGTGNDKLEGGTGNDTYEFALGFGIDTIYDSDTTEGNVDTISFLGSIAPEDVIVTRNGENLELTIVGNADKLIIERYFSEYARSSGWSSYYVGPNGNKIEKITFADGTVWTIDTIKEVVRHINGTEGDDYLQGLEDQNNIIAGGAGDDVIYAGGLGDEMDGGAGDDVLYGSYGNDTLDGGTGDDVLEGGLGNDTYLFNIGSGNDTIYDSDSSEGNLDKIIFGSGILASDVTLQRDGDNLVFALNGSSDTLTIERYFSQYGRSNGWSQPHVGINGNKVEQIQFADGTVWGNETVIEKMSHILGTAGDDSLVGIDGQQSKLSGLDGDDTLTAGSFGDYLDGGAGNDTLNGSYGQDVLRGGTGNDTLTGGAGSDTYIFAAGDGHDTIYDGDSSYATDTISFMEGIDPSDVEASRDGNNLILKINGGNDDSITIQDYFSGVIQGTGYDYGIGVNKVERITFADGTIWDTVSLEDQFRYITGTAGDDTLNGYETDDVITAQEGNDIIHAGTGHDTVDAGDGNDTVYGEAGNDQLSGGAGDDMLDGGVGNDILDGGAGNDVLVGGEGSDTYIFRLGDGTDEIRDFSTNASEVDIVAFQDGVLPQNVTVQRNGDDLVLAIANTTDSLTIKGYYSAYRDGDQTEYEVGVNKVEQVTFADGTIWNNRTIEYAVTDNNGVVDPNITFGTFHSESLVADEDGQIIYADEGDDTLVGQAGNDILHGEAGDDVIYGGQGDDTLIGGLGNDYLDGGEGNDIYRFSPGFGHDTIVDYDTTQGNIDTIAFDAGIVPDDVTLSRVGNNLVLTLATGDSITVQSYFAGAVSGYRKIEQVTFTNGTVWDTAFLETAVPPTSTYDNTIEGTENDDYLYGTSGNDAISGGAGNDTIYSDNGTYDGIGNDLLDGGTGNDTLYGAGGDDTYVFGLGYGQDYLRDELRSGSGAYIDGGFDTLKVLPGVAPEDVVIRRSGIDLILEIKGTTDSMTIGAFFREVDGVYTSGIERVEFSDTNQTTWTLEDLVHKARNIEGTSESETLYGYEGQDNILSGGGGDDTVYGASGNDTLDGGAGNDILRGGYGDDTYIFGIGYGVDTIDDSDATEGNQDTIQFLEGIAPEDVLVKRNGNNLELSIAGTEDKLIVERYFSPYDRNGYHTGSVDGNKIEHIKFADNTSWGIADVKDKARHISGTDNDDSLYGFDDQQNIITAGDGNDTVYAGSLGDQIDGGAGNDSLYGSSGNDTLTGGDGNDKLEGSGGNDRYIFAPGFGNDTIYDIDATEGNIDIIQFLEGISPENVIAKRDGDNLILAITGTTDTLTVERYFSQYTRNGYNAGSPDAQKIEVIEFANGTTWDIADIKDKVRYINGTENSETIYGFNDQQNIVAAGDGDDTVYAGSLGDYIDGGAGNDNLYGSSGNDTLIGGSGNDKLEGGSGDDTYIFALGFGNDTIYDIDASEGNADTIRFLEGIDPTDVVAVRNGDDLVLTVAGTSDSLTVDQYFSQYTRNGYSAGGLDAQKIEVIEFANGTTWNIADIKEKVRNINGTEGDDYINGYSDQHNIILAGSGDDTVYAGSLGDRIDGGGGNDSLYGSSGDDTLIGGTGNDLLEGGSGNDRYIFAPGFGNDTIYDIDSTEGNIDTIQFLEGIDPAGVVATRSGDDLVLTVSDTSDSLIVDQYFSQYTRNGYSAGGVDAQKIEVIEFANGTTWSIADIKDKVRHMNGTESSDTVSGYDTDDIINGLAGDDTLYGNGGDDTLIGGTGNDMLYGGSGDDVYVFGIGDGQDIVRDDAGVDAIQFGTGINPEDIVITRTSGSYVDQNNLVLGIRGTNDMVTIQGYFHGGLDSETYKIEQIIFDNGTVWTVDDIKEKLRTFTGTEGNDSNINFGDQDLTAYGLDGDDTLYGSSFVDKLYGGNGNDNLYASGGNDLLDGGAGDDYLDGGSGNDTYIFGRGYGADIIQDYGKGQGDNDIVTFLEGVAPEDIIVTRTSGYYMDQNNLVLRIRGTSDQLTVRGYFHNGIDNPNYQISEFHFADNTVWTHDDIKEKLRTYTGTEGNDTNVNHGDQDLVAYGLGGDDILQGSGYIDHLYGGDGNDTLYAGGGDDLLDGGAGNDMLFGESGDDTYVFSGNFGNDQISDNGGSDLAIFDQDQNNLIFEQVGNALRVSVTDSTDGVTVNSWYSSSSYKIETFKASDGSTISDTNIEQLIQAMASWSSNNGGMSWSQALSSNSQDVQAIISQYWTAPTA